MYFFQAMIMVNKRPMGSITHMRYISFLSEVFSCLWLRWANWLRLAKKKDCFGNSVSQVTCSNDTVHVPCPVEVTVEVLTRGLQFLIIAWHHSHMVYLIWSQALLGGEVILDQGTHDLLGGLGGTYVWENVGSVGLLCIADPT